MLQPTVKKCSDCELLVNGACVFAPRRVEEDVVITAQGEIPSEVSFVRSGVVSLSRIDPVGEETWGAVRGPRSMLGLEALEGVGAACEVRAITPVELCTASLPTVQGWLATAGGARTMFELTLKELVSHRRDVDFRTGPAEVRVARFCLACEALLRSSQGPAQFSKVRVAALVGIRPETLSRVLRRLQDSGLVDSSEGIRILDRKGLAQVAAQEAPEGQ